VGSAPEQLEIVGARSTNRHDASTCAQWLDARTRGDERRSGRTMPSEPCSPKVTAVDHPNKRS